MRVDLYPTEAAPERVLLSIAIRVTLHYQSFKWHCGGSVDREAQSVCEVWPQGNEASSLSEKAERSFVQLSNVNWSHCVCVCKSKRHRTG